MSVKGMQQPFVNPMTSQNHTSNNNNIPSTNSITSAAVAYQQQLKSPPKKPSPAIPSITHSNYQFNTKDSSSQQLTGYSQRSVINQKPVLWIPQPQQKKGNTNHKNNPQNPPPKTAATPLFPAASGEKQHQFIDLAEEEEQ